MGRLGTNFDGEVAAVGESAGFSRAGKCCGPVGLDGGTTPYCKKMKLSRGARNVSLGSKQGGCPPSVDPWALRHI